jgi:transposase
VYKGKIFPNACNSSTDYEVKLILFICRPKVYGCQQIGCCPPTKEPVLSANPTVTARCSLLYYLLCRGMQWKALPRLLGVYSTVHDRFQQG